MIADAVEKGQGSNWFCCDCWGCRMSELQRESAIGDYVQVRRARGMIQEGPRDLHGSYCCLQICVVRELDCNPTVAIDARSKYVVRGRCIQ